ncbi:TldD/PmbA family protein [Alisedimentitalea sp. MJ-SS2]|uniref:TldD/PmbA family protein n=1 Tax=Aliisedimentitalea sp. MJ-SS2 TaxID=3049795 RepID=UPI00290E9BE9|nr:TldD/PmbA family protein [Alisedimentitalea sp. MJ-SS2]MDU8927748.1 TldD/PmbA family protein [Alisedimentitalea sp. MJ-SS2]
MTASPESLSHTLLDAAKKAGAEAADVLVIEGRSISIDVREGKLEQAERSEGIDLGLRVLLGKRQAMVSSSDSRPETMAAMAERAVAMAKEAPENPDIGLATSEQLATDWDAAGLELADPGDEPAPASLQEQALAAEAATQAVEGVTQVQSASAGYSARSMHFAATNGFSGGYARTSHSLYSVAIAGEGAGMERDHDGDSRVFAADMRGADEIGRIAGERAVAALGAKKPPTGTFPVLFDERISSSLIGHLLGAVNGSAVARGESFLRESLGEQVLPSSLSLLEEPHRKRMGSSRPFDAEGLATADRMIVKDGVLQGWTLDLATGRKLGMESTANALRGTGSAPSPGTFNVALTQGTQTREELLNEMGTGLLVTSMIGSTINPNTGDYSRGASGFWVENGEITYPVNECTIAGNLRDMLLGLIPANDARTWLSRVVPSLLVEGLTLAGE